MTAHDRRGVQPLHTDAVKYRFAKVSEMKGKRCHDCGKEEEAWDVERHVKTHLVMAQIYGIPGEIPLCWQCQRNRERLHKERRSPHGQEQAALF